MTDLQAMVGRDEQIMWQGKPDKKCFLLESIFNPMLVVAFIWGAIDFGIIGVSLFTMESQMILFLVAFFALHLMPVWLYIGGVLFSVRKYKNTEYIVTDRGIYISGGVFTYNYEMKPFTDLAHINIHRGIFDQMLGVGDVVLECSHDSYSSHSSNSSKNAHRGISIIDISDYQYVFSLVKDLQTDIYADTMYPNDLRPEGNHGYQTRYIRDRR